MFKDEFRTKGLLSLVLQTGREILASKCLFSPTYAELLVGWPNAADNQSHLAAAASRVQAALGCWPTHVIEPESVMTTRGTPRLPVVEVAALFHSLTAADESWTGLVLVWYQEEMCPAVSSRNRELIARVEWESLAQPFDF